MKKIFCFVFLFSCFFCVNVLAEEEILSFHSDIFVEKDGSLIIEEKIQVRAEGKSIKRGIYRDLPFYYAKEKTPLEVKSVLRDGRAIPYSFGDVKSREKRIYMGDMGKEIQAGIYEYKILYTYQNVIRKNFLKTEDVLRLNLIGTEWSFPILKATAKIHLPKGIELAYHPTVYTGKRGSKVESASVKIYPEMIEVESSGKLHPNEGITIDVRFKKGVLTIPIFTTVQKINLLFYGVIVFGFIAICVYAYLSWKKYGRDAVAKPIYPRFDVPKEVGIGALVRLLYHNKPKNETRMTLISAHFADLLQKGFIKIYTDPNGKWIEIKKVENIYPKTPEEEFFVLNAEDVYFLCVEKRHKKFAEYVSDYGDFATEQSEVLVKRNEEKIKDFFFMVCKFYGLIILMVTVLNFFRAENVDNVVIFAFLNVFMLTFFCVVTGIIFVAQAVCVYKISRFIILLILVGFIQLYFVFLHSFHLGGSIVFSMVFCFLLLLTYVKIIGKMDEKAVSYIEHLKGIKMFLETTDDLKYKTIEQAELERLLPYAIILGIQNKWAEKMRRYFDFSVQNYSLFVGENYINNFSYCMERVPTFSGCGSSCGGGGCSGSSGGGSGSGAGGGGGGGF